jgi:hypothetical protein
MIEYPLDDDAEDITDAEWAELQLQERHQLEESMLTADPGYREFLRSTVGGNGETRSI